jgi:hypothetical protein
MQTSNLDSTYHECSLVRRVAERFSIARLVDHFQGALFNLELFGPSCAAVIVSSFFMLISSLHQWADCGAEKGVI